MRQVWPTDAPIFVPGMFGVPGIAPDHGAKTLAFILEATPRTPDQTGAVASDSRSPFASTAR